MFEKYNKTLFNLQIANGLYQNWNKFICNGNFTLAFNSSQSPK